MNIKLKAKIIEVFTTQADFAVVAGVDEPFVSRVVRGRRSLSEDQQKEWATMLGCGRKDIFSNEKQQ